MADRIALTAALFTSFVLMPGCPGAASGLAGTWILSIGASDVGIVLEANGDATAFPIDFGLVGTLTWRVDGDHFFMDQMGSGGARTIYAGTVSNDGTSMTGARVTYAGINTGSANTWTAEKAPS